MTWTAPATPWTVYLLHFERKVRGAQHYLGITRSARLDRRMHDHCGEHGSRLTALACKSGIGFTLARTWPAESLDLEKRLKASGHFAKLCPICRGELDLNGSRRTFSPRIATQSENDWESYPRTAAAAGSKT